MILSHVMNAPCAICHENPSKYTCAQCSDIVYCSVTCYKEHAATHTSPAVPPKNISKKSRDTPTEALEDMEGVMTRKQMHALAVDPKIIDQLKSRELQQLILSIDSSRNRLDALETAEYNIPEFATFVDHVSGVLFESQ
uniref:HIT-type domain-containing protein n=1 Tax=Paramoeba aestuarina TaxID=180227 RepID=A0A7S4UJH6_9EUKA